MTSFTISIRALSIGHVDTGANTSIPTHEPVSVFTVYLVEILSMPNVLRLLVLEKKTKNKKQKTHESLHFLLEKNYMLH